MKTSTKIKILLGLGYGLIFLVIAALFWKQPWFWVTCLAIAFNVVCGTIGAALIYSKFFKRRLTLEIFGVWVAIVFVGFVVLLVGAFYKPKYVAY